MPFIKGQKPHNFKDLSGKKFNMLSVLSYAGKRKGSILWNCKCECGSKTTATSYELTHGAKKSCGCLRTAKRVSLDFIGYENEDVIVTSLSEEKSGKERLWNYRCKHCGKENRATKGNIKRKMATCKCIHYKRVSEGESLRGRKTRIYRIWSGMKSRCFNSNEHCYKNYGGIGITVCSEWKNNFEAFYDWAISNGYKDGLSIERKDVDGDYCPENCEWIEFKKQARNKRNTLYIEINGETKRLKEWCEIYDANYKTVYQRIYRYGIKPLDALTKKER